MPTRQGWAALAAGGGLLVSGRVFGLIELSLLGTGVVGLALAAAVLVSLRCRGLHLTIDRVLRPAVVAVGEPAVVELTVSRSGGVARSPRLDLWEPVDLDGLGVAAALAPLRRDESARTTYAIPTARRGRIVVGPARWSVSDPLGLACREQMVAGTREVLVIPRRVSLSFPHLASAGRVGQYLRDKAWGSTAGEFHSQREYVPGDDLRRINWKASARTGELMVRETTPEGARRCTVVLDTTMHATDPDAFERAVSAAASVMSAAAGAAVDCRFVARDADFRGPTAEQDALVWLATAPGDARPVDPAAAGRITSDGLGLVVVVAATSDALSVRHAERAASPDDIVLVVVTGTPDPMTGSDPSLATGTSRRALVVSARSLEEMAERWNGLVDGQAGR